MAGYRFATAKRKYSSTPIVHVTIDDNGKEIEEAVLCAINMKKKEGDILSQHVIDILNQHNNDFVLKSCFGN